MIQLLVYKFKKKAGMLLEQKAWKRIVMALSCIVVFTTTYMLILPAITLDQKTAGAEAGISAGLEAGAAETDIAALADGVTDGYWSEEADIVVGSADDGEMSFGPDDSEMLYQSGELLSTEDAAVECLEEGAEEAAESVYLTGIQTAVGSDYTVTVDVPEEALIPADAYLAVEEITGEEYDFYYAQAMEALGVQSMLFARFFDISIVENGEKIQPAEGSAADVTIELADSGSSALSVVHFGEETQIMENSAEDGTVAFETTGFSVYAIVEAPEPVNTGGWTKVSSLDELADLGADGLYMRHPDGFYFTDQQYTVSGSRTGIRKTKPAAATPDAAGESSEVYYFEPVAGSDDQFKVYCLDENDNPKYVRQSGNSLSFAQAASATTFTVSEFPGQGETFRVLGTGGYYWNMQGGTGGNGFAAYNAATDTNARIQFEYYVPPVDDPYGLDGQSFGIAYHDESVTSSALTAEGVSGRERLAGQDMLMKPDVLDNDGILLVAENTDIAMWTFESIGGDLYYISTTIDGATKYLTISGSSVTLADVPDETLSAVKVRPGTGENAGKWRFSVGNYALNFSGSSANGFYGATGSGATTYMNLVEESILTEDDFRNYSAKKVSVSDDINVYNGQQVILYTRIWNDTTKRYEFYAVDHDGTLIRCYDSGDTIEWIGSQVNTALWELTEYTNPDGTLSHFYELRNTQYSDYIGPQVSSGQILSDGPVGINLSGRRYGQSQTTITAWDDQNYSYSGLKAENGRVVACALSESEDFYFAVINPRDLEDSLTTVDTVDNTQYGITMKMMDFNNRLVNGRDSVQHGFFGSRESGTPPLLSTDLDENGYPVTTAITGHEDSLSVLFNDMADVNHLFIQSIYNESGYFEYDSTQNFATILDEYGNPGTDFTVYNQLAAIGEETRSTRVHGQFMPYNNIGAGRYAYDRDGNLITNRTDGMAQELPDSNPRKGEKLYGIPQNGADYFFGMEMEATFTQTASGLDAWGHDIIFEFSGDDDFWFYVDGELVLDIGGVHSAQAGSVNFRTGEVVCKGVHTTLIDVFRQNYVERGLSEEQINEKLDEIFDLNDEGNYVFRDYTNHVMRMFYMERGAGASNLHMRFNLAAVKPGAFILGKKLSGTENEKNDLIEFPYQIYYKSIKGGDWILLGTNEGEAGNVLYQGTNRVVRHVDSFTPAGGTNSYEHVFFLKPGEYAEVNMPQDVTEYYVVECGVNPDVYDLVTANGDAAAETATGNYVGSTERMDYSIPGDTLKNRSKVDYVNNVHPGAMRNLSVTKRLYDEDGEHLLHYDTDDESEKDETTFSLRLYLGNESSEEEHLPLASVYPYYVKDRAGNYCRWDVAGQRFASLGITDYDDLRIYMASLTSAEKESIIFRTSLNGSISRIPADYTVEVRDLIVDTKYKVEERENEIPKGYTLRLSDGYSRVDDGHEATTETVPMSGTMKIDETPDIEVRNQKGWGLTVVKEWTDADFMEMRDPVYFAVYLTDEDGDFMEIIDGSVRQLVSAETEVYYFFGSLQGGIPFERYVVREVIPAGDYAVDDAGRVTGYTTVTPIEDGETYEIGGRPVGGVYHPADQDDAGYSYVVSYTPGEQTTHNENVRIDTVTNARPGIKLYKKDTENEALPGAVFTLTDAEGNHVAAPSYTSGNDGLITIAYLNEGAYTLTETRAPKGYAALNQPLTITVDAEGGVLVAGSDTDLYEVDLNPGEGMTAAITVIDRPTGLLVKKTDAVTGGIIPGVHFALYAQVEAEGGGKRKDYLPMTGYEDLVTNADGILTEISIGTLTWGNTYYLTETQPAEGYGLLTEDLCFTIGTNGVITVSSSGHESWLSKETDPLTGQVSYVIAIPNGQKKKVSFKKVDTADIVNSALEGAVFDLYPTEPADGVYVRGEEPLYTGLISGSDGLLRAGTETEFTLPVGIYHLVETAAPTGYEPRTAAVIITVTDESDDESIDYEDGAVIRGVTYDDGTILSAGKGKKYDAETGVYTLKISNSSGVILPSTGGAGSDRLRIIGALLFGCAAALRLLYGMIRKRI